MVIQLRLIEPLPYYKEDLHWVCPELIPRRTVMFVANCGAGMGSDVHTLSGIQ